MIINNINNIINKSKKHKNLKKRYILQINQMYKSHCQKNNKIKYKIITKNFKNNRS